MTKTNPHTWLLAASFACLSLLCLTLGCGRAESGDANDPSPSVNQPQAANEAAPTDDPSPTPQPKKPDGVDWDDWMHDRPFVSAMRLMWVDCGVIIGNSYHPDIADTSLLQYSAEDLAQRAERFAVHLRGVRDENREGAMSAKAGDWSAATSHLETAHRACGGCHFEFWPLQARQFVAGTLRGWHESQDVFANEPWGEQVFTAPATVRLSMVTMRDTMNKAFEAADKQDLEAMLKATEVLHKMSDKQLKAWEGIKQQAEAIARLASENKLDGVGDHYVKMTGYCRDCHKSSSDGRGIDPLPWTQE